MNDDPHTTKPDTSSRVQRAEWMLYVIGAIAGVVYVGPYFGRLTGYYEGLFSLVFVVVVVGLVHVLKPFLEKFAGEKNARE